MKIIYAKFRGYAGFYHGMGLETLEIDFSKSKYNIVLIVGKNGCGKSTLLSALNIFPDNNSCFRNNVEGEKLLRILDKNDVYDIRILYPIDSNGNRKTTKAFISRNGLELNPNGNVTSYKDLLSTEFDLDPNFVGLSMLTSIDRGLGDKRPAERKKFVASVIDNLVTYNNIYKTLNKKSLIYKSHVNTIHTKIQSAGDKQALEANLSQLRSQEATLENNIQTINDTIVSIKAKNSVDPEDAENIKRLNDQKDSIKSQLDSISVSLSTYINKTKIEPENIEEVESSNRKLLDSYTIDYESYKTQWKEKSNTLSQTQSTIHNLEVSLSEVSNGLDDKIEKRYNDIENEISQYIEELNSLGVEPNTNSINEISDILTFYSDFIRRLELFYDGLDAEQIKYIAIDYDPNMVSNLTKKSESISKEIEKLQGDIKKIQDDLKTLSVLDNRPDTCNIDTCPFIKEAISINKMTDKKKLSNQLQALQDKIMKLSCDLTENQENIVFYNSLIPKRMDFQVLTEIFENINTKYPESKYISDLFKNLNVNIGNINSFNEVRNPDVLVRALNILKQLDDSLKEEVAVKASYESHREQVKFLNSTNSTLEKLKADSETLSTEIQNLKSKVDSTNSIIEELQSNLQTQSLYLETYKESERLVHDLSAVADNLEIYLKKSSKAVDSMNQIQQLENDISVYKNELIPVKNAISDINGRLTLLNSYYQEYEAYNASYKIIETLKKYCSPTGGGIQTIFMQLYMEKTLQLSNQILSMLFGGEYQLADFIINENEFRIPFIGNGLNVDDISSGSNSQICMMGMVINLVLLHQASTKYNIAYLDEIDAGLDHKNRFEFINALYRSIPLLEIDQLFMISHSMEADTSSVDIIKLQGYEDFEDTVQMGNIIFDINNCTN